MIYHSDAASSLAVGSQVGLKSTKGEGGPWIGPYDVWLELGTTRACMYEL